MLSLISRYFNSLFQIDFWDVFVSQANFKEFLNSKGKILANNRKVFTGKNTFFADPFFLSVKNSKLEFIVEDFSFFKGARLSHISYDYKKENLKKKTLIKGKHFSYPFILNKGRNIYVFPEMSEESQNFIFQLKKKKLKPLKNYLFSDHVVDPTIVKHNKTYWMFCSLKNLNENKNLYLFYSNNIFGNWIAHPNNPIIKNKNFARPAGQIIIYKKKLYRPSQDFSEGYGSRLYLNLITKLNKLDYKEKILFKLKPMDKKYNGIHHISFKNKSFIFDQKYTVYSIKKFFYYLLKKFYFKKFTN